MAPSSAARPAALVLATLPWLTNSQIVTGEAYASAVQQGLQGQLEQLRQVLSLDASFASAAISSTGATALHFSSAKGNSGMVALLLSHGASVSATTNGGATALSMACSAVMLDVAVLLIDNGARNEPSCGAASLHAAVSTSRAHVVERLLEGGASVSVADSEDGSTPLHLAAITGDAAIASLLLRYGASTESRYYISGEQPLHVAAIKSKPAVAKLLLEAGASVTARTVGGQDALHACAVWGEGESGREVLEGLLAHGADANAVGRLGASALHEAASRGWVAAMRVLLGHGHGSARVEQRDAYGDTALFWACSGCHESAAASVQLLLEHGANVEAANRFGLTPLHAAAFVDCAATSESILGLLLEPHDGLEYTRAAVEAADALGLSAVDVAATEAARSWLLEAAGYLARAERDEQLRRSRRRRELADEAAADAAGDGAAEDGAAAADAAEAGAACGHEAGSAPTGAPSAAAPLALRAELSAEWRDAANRLRSPLERRLLIDAEEPSRVPASQLVHELAQIKRSLTFDRRVRGMLHSAEKAALLRARAVLPPEACATLRAAVDAHASLRNGTTDGMPEHTVHLERAELERLIGTLAVEQLWRLPGRYREQAGGGGGGSSAPPPPPRAMEIFLRRFSASTRPWIKMHADVADVTVNVALSNDDDYPGGRLLGVFAGKVRAVSRRAGDATVHPSSLLHGVSRMTEGARYTLILFFS